MGQFPASGLTQVLLYTLFVVAEKGKTYVLAKNRSIHKNIKNKERTVIVKFFVKDTVCH